MPYRPSPEDGKMCADCLSAHKGACICPLFLDRSDFRIRQEEKMLENGHDLIINP
jgi:hypothetical protein